MLVDGPMAERLTAPVAPGTPGAPSACRSGIGARWAEAGPCGLLGRGGEGCSGAVEAGPQLVDKGGVVEGADEDHVVDVRPDGAPRGGDGQEVDDVAPNPEPGAVLIGAVRRATWWWRWG